MRNTVLLYVFCCCLSASGLAAQITGTVTNGTTNKPVAGHEVVLLSLARGMDEAGRTTTDAKGHYSLDVPDPDARHLVRVNYQGVNYFQPAPQGATTAEITVYDSAKQIDHVIEEGHVFGMQTIDGQLEVREIFVLRNESKPARTRMSERSYEVVLPEGAQVEDGTAAGPGGMPVQSSPVPTAEKNHYAFVFPIRPGKTRFEISYKLPYTGSHEFSVVPNENLAELGIMLPKSMKFQAPGDLFAKAQDEEGMDVYVAKSVPPKKPVTFSISGQGAAPQESASTPGQVSGPANGPGGGMAPPNQEPTSMNNPTWALLAILAVSMLGGGIWIWLRSRTAAGTDAARPATTKGAAARGTAEPSMLEALKEELFQLESDHVRGAISNQDYESAKAGLHALIRRNVKKSG